MLALATCSGVLASLAVPARVYALSCPAPDPLAAENAVAIVTRVDGGGPAGAFRVEHADGAPTPPLVVARMQDGLNCGPSVHAAGGVAALVLEGLSVVVPPAGQYGRWTDYAFERVLGPPEAVRGGPPVAVAAGGFGGARLVALDSAGRAVAWDGLAGWGQAVEACPGRRRVIAFGQGEHGAELTVHDAATLQVRRTVSLPLDPYALLLAMRCRDETGRTVELIAADDGDAPRYFRVNTARPDEVTSRALRGIPAATGAPGGFLAAAHPDPSLVLLRPNGTRLVVVAETGFTSIADVVASADGRYVAVRGNPAHGAESIATFDARTGRRLGGLDAEEDSDLAWTADHRLLLRAPSGYGGHLRPVQVFDRRLRPVDRLPAAPGHDLAGIGDAAVSFGAARVTVTPVGGKPWVLEPLRLAGANDVAGLPGAGFSRP